jgi:outer membrane protein assembly factor BamD
MKRINFVILGSILLLSGCKHWWNTDDDQNPYKGISAQQLYADAKTALQKQEYTSAIKRLEALDTMYPFHEHAEQAELDLIYAYYAKEEYVACAATAERFIHLYPRSQKVDYAYYMKGLADFQQVRGNLAHMLPMDESWRDPGTQSQAYSDFATLIQKYPNSRYKANALQRMIYLRNMFAQRELHTALYYFDRKMYVASIERAKFLIKTYPQAPSAREALSVSYYGNLALGLKDAAEDDLKVYLATYHTPPKMVSVDVTLL